MPGLITKHSFACWLRNTPRQRLACKLGFDSRRTAFLSCHGQLSRHRSFTNASMATDFRTHIRCVSDHISVASRLSAAACCSQRSNEHACSMAHSGMVPHPIQARVSMAFLLEGAIKSTPVFCVAERAYRVYESATRTYVMYPRSLRDTAVCSAGSHSDVSAGNSRLGGNLTLNNCDLFQVRSTEPLAYA